MRFIHGHGLPFAYPLGRLDTATPQPICLRHRSPPARKKNFDTATCREKKFLRPHAQNDAARKNVFQQTDKTVKTTLA